MTEKIFIFQFIFICLSLARFHDCSNVNEFELPSFKYLGCFNDKREQRDIIDKDFSFITKYNKSIPTVELCTSMCFKNGFKYAGVQAYDECYCGNTYGRYNSTENSRCFFNCDKKYTCGGYNANSVYSIEAPAGVNNLETSSTRLPLQSLKQMPKLTVPVATDPCKASLCLNSGKCVVTDDQTSSRGYICECMNKMDSGQFCEERNYCASSPCYNGGTCSNTFNGFECKCSEAWRGFNCRYRALIQQPTSDSPEIASQQTTPTYSPLPQTTSYQFMTTKKIPFTQEVTIPKYASSDCLSYGKQCKNGGRCVKLGYVYTCQCMPGYSGTTCENYEGDICSRTNPCLNSGKCTAKTPLTFECECGVQYEGARCEKTKIPCDGVVCQNSGVCVNNATSFDYYCLCGKNFAGKLCNECKPNFAGDKCDTCMKGFAGENCDLTSPFCSPNPCKNGLCLWDSTGFRCVCSEGWTGKNCTVQNCVLKPCLNQGVCKGIFDSIQNQMDYQCACAEGYSGKDCEIENDPCQPSPCKQGEECIRSKTEYTCLKPTNLCERLQPCNKNSECIYSKEENTFSCRCLNGASECEAGVASTGANREQDSSIPGLLLLTNQTINANNETRVNIEGSETKDIPKVGFNYDNLYWILPLCLVVFVVVFFVSIVVYFGFKARNRSAKFSKKSNNIRNIHYVNETMNYDENLKPIPNISSTSISYSDHNSEKEFADGFGRV